MQRRGTKFEIVNREKEEEEAAKSHCVENKRIIMKPKIKKHNLSERIVSKELPMKIKKHEKDKKYIVEFNRSNFKFFVVIFRKLIL